MYGHQRGHCEHYVSVLLLLIVLMGSSTTIGAVVTSADTVPEKYRASFEAAQSAIMAGKGVSNIVPSLINRQCPGLWRRIFLADEAITLHSQAIKLSKFPGQQSGLIIAALPKSLGMKRYGH